MEEIVLNNLKPVSKDKVIELMRYLYSYYRDGMSVGRAYDDIAHVIHNGKYPNPRMSQAVLDGAHSSREAELAHILDLIFIKLRDFFTPLEYEQ